MVITNKSCCAKTGSYTEAIPFYITLPIPKEDRQVRQYLTMLGKLWLSIGEWISARDAFDVGGEDLLVLHFTHDPIGWICISDDCFS
jgi:hypothetical protein